jgi:hypothetical protein
VKDDLDSTGVDAIALKELGLIGRNDDDPIELCNQGAGDHATQDVWGLVIARERACSASNDTQSRQQLGRCVSVEEVENV